MTSDQRREAYRADVVYAPLTQIGFDVLHDGLVETVEERVLTGPDHLIVDECDSILVDQARIPLVIAGSWGEDSDPFTSDAMNVVTDLVLGDHFEVDDGRTAVWLTERGQHEVERRLGGIRLYDRAHSDALTAVNLALHARALAVRDVDYVVTDGGVHIIDTSRGRVAHGRRWPDGLQEAVEIKERLPRSGRGMILDQLTVPALVRTYRSVAGMSGTAYGAREALDELYRLPVVRVPPHRPRQRVDEPIRVFDTAEHARSALVARVIQQHGIGQPVLVGTQSVAESERLSSLLDDSQVPHAVLNAKNDAVEANLVALAGRTGAVTVSTQMAGRGTDIALMPAADGDIDPRDRGGLLVLALGMYPSSRLDDQLRGRAGRQGEPGRSAIYVALDDGLIVSHGPDTTAWRTAAGTGGRIDTTSATASVRHAQRVAEGIDHESLLSTWRYYAVIASHRSQFQAARESILANTENTLSRRVHLAALDRRWSNHLGLLSELREGIHLRVMARVNPWLSFNADAESDFATLVLDARTEADGLLATHLDARDPGDLGLRRPSATWTYLLADMHLGDETERVIRALRHGVFRRTSSRS